MRVLLLAAGYGTRLYPLTINTPKALLSIGKKPFINSIFDKLGVVLKKFKVTEIVVVSNNKFYKKSVRIHSSSKNYKV